MFDLWRAVDQVLQQPELHVPRRSYSQWPGESGVSYEIDGRMIRIGTCRRRAVYRYLNYSPDGIGEGFDSLFKKDCGNYTQGLFRECLHKAKIHVGTEVPISIIRDMGELGQYRLSGRIDEIIANPEANGQAEAIEFKTKGAYKESGLMKATKDKPLSPDPGEVCQVMPYIDWLGMPAQGIPNPVVNMCYFSREGARSQFHITLNDAGQAVIESQDDRVVTWTHVNLEAIYADFDAKAVAIANHEIPDRDYEAKWTRETVIWKAEHGELNKTDTKKVETAVKKGTAGAILDKGDWQCAYCPYQLGCYGQRPDFGPMEDNLAIIGRKGEALPGQKLTQQEVHVPETPGG